MSGVLILFVAATFGRRRAGASALTRDSNYRFNRSPASTPSAFASLPSMVTEAL